MSKEDIRYIARFIVETNTPIAVGSGEKGLTVDRLIARDANELPYIPGTSLAGIVRHELDNNIEEGFTNNIFGYQGDGNDGQGSRINFSSAILLADNGETVLEGLQKIDFTKNYYSYFKRLPERDHVRITHRGTADTLGHGKFDEQLVYKGTRFVFGIELEGTKADRANWNIILEVLHHPALRIGAGTRKGFGQLNIIECKYTEIDLKENLKKYLTIASSLNNDVTTWEDYNVLDQENSNYHHYKVSLEPVDFFIFGAGIGDGDVDMAPKTEKYFEWNENTPSLSEEKILIPASSIKGALSHRVGYWYNKFNEITIESNMPEYNSLNNQELIDSISELKEFNDKIKTFSKLFTKDFSEEKDVKIIKELKSDLEKKKEDILNVIVELRALNTGKLIEDSYLWEDYNQLLEKQLNEFKELNPNVGELNKAVQELFGYAKDSKKKNGLRGRFILSDLYKNKSETKEKVFDHVAIDRFTGGGIEGALYQEKAVMTNGFVLNIFVEINAFPDKTIKKAFEKALDDLVKGKLQLGGNVGKGHGAFTGSYELINAE